MITLIYASSAVRLMLRDELVTLLQKAREKNQHLNVTGMLLYKGGNFLQILEGPETEVNSLFDTIKRDIRHTGVTLILRRNITERQFPDWEMGFTEIDAELVQKLPGYSSFLNTPLNADELQRNPSYAYRFMLTFKEIMR